MQSGETDDGSIARGTPIEVSETIWDEHAAWWLESFSDGADIEYALEIIPFVARVFDGRRLVLDLGTGEGQVARAVAARPGSPTVVGLDPSSAQLANNRAKRRDAAIALVQGAGEELPFASGCFDGVVCCLVIEHCEDVDRVLAEVARVLAPGGVFLLLINHPIYQGIGSGFIDDQILGEHYWRVGPYLEERVSFEEVDNGVVLPFAHRPLSRYLNPLAARDLLLVDMFEPPPLPGFLADSVDPDLEGAIPRLLAMRFEHRPRPANPGTR